MIYQFRSLVYIWKKVKILIGKDTCTPLFIIALFIIVNMWKQTKLSMTR